MCWPLQLLRCTLFVKLATFGPITIQYGIKCHTDDWRWWLQFKSQFWINSTKTFCRKIICVQKQLLTNVLRSHSPTFFFQIKFDYFKFSVSQFTWQIWQTINSIKSNKPNRIEESIDVLGSEKVFVIIKARTHSPGHCTAYWSSEPSVIPFSKPGTPTAQLSYFSVSAIFKVQPKPPLKPPKYCTKNFVEFSGKQQKLSAYFNQNSSDLTGNKIEKRKSPENGNDQGQI